jgi:mevalonate kinase
MGNPLDSANGGNTMAPAPNGSSHLNGAVNGLRVGGPKLERKESSPMAPPFMVSAPGKVIVCGEHSVVHGKVMPSSCQVHLPLDC